MPSTHARTSFSARPLRRLAWLCLAALADLGCSGEITVLPGGSPDETEDETCVPGENGAQPDDPSPLVLTAVRSATFLGDTLHLEATLDGVPRYVVLSIDADGIARAVATPDELLGPAALAEVAPGAHVRFRIGESGNPILDVLDTSSHDSPALLSSSPFDGVTEGPPVFSAADARAFFCKRPYPGETASLFSVDLTTPAEPSPPEPADSSSFFCHFYGANSFATAASTTIAWNHPSGSFVQQVYLWSLGPDGPEKVVDLGYNQTGVHQYGNVISAATSRDRAVFDPENESLFLLANPGGDPASTDNPPFAWATFSAGAERHLLGVADTTVYLTTDDAVRAYDITDILSPKLLPYMAWLAPHKTPLVTLATSPRYLAVIDNDGVLFLLPRTPTGTVAPLVVHAPDYAPKESDTGCSD